MIRKANAVWKGTLKEGNGTVSTPSDVLHETPYSFKTRFEDEPGTNPEELVAAAHAGCFSMALSGQLANMAMKPETIQTDATLTMEKQEGGWTITQIHLQVNAKIPGADPKKFQEAANNAKNGCPISRLLKANITMEAKLS